MTGPEVVIAVVGVLAITALAISAQWADRGPVAVPHAPGVWVTGWGIYATRVEGGELAHEEFETVEEALTWWQETSR